MKFSLALLAALAATAIAIPNPDPYPDGDDAAVPEPIPVPADAPYLDTRNADASAPLEKRKPCYYPSTCSWFNAAKCEHYCRRNGTPGYETVGVDRMEKCNLLNEKRCCCSR